MKIIIRFSPVVYSYPRTLNFKYWLAGITLKYTVSQHLLFTLKQNFQFGPKVEHFHRKTSAIAIPKLDFYYVFVVPVFLLCHIFNCPSSVSCFIL